MTDDELKAIDHLVAMTLESWQRLMNKYHAEHAARGTVGIWRDFFYRRNAVYHPDHLPEVP